MSDTSDIMRLAETGFSEWNNPEEDIYKLPMNDAESLTLKAFLATLEQNPTLSESEQQEITRIFENLEGQVMQLHHLASNSDNLKTDYKKCRRLLTSDAATRGMGRFAKTDSTPESEPGSELENIVRSLNSLDNKTKKELNKKAKSWLTFWKS